MQLRPYQQEAIIAIYDHLRSRDDNPCVAIPTAGGKTPVMATICRDVVQKWNGRVPFSFVSYIGSPFTGHLKTDLFFDERLPLKEDYDLTLQHLNKHRRVLRFNGYYYYVKQAKQAGGCAAYRNLDREREQFELLQRKWGRDIIRRDHGSKRSFDFNPILKPPIKGV